MDSSSTIKLKDKVLDLSTPKIMGVLNVTPDSFSDGGQFNTFDAAMERIRQMIAEGAAIIDVGGESTRPGSEPVSMQQECDRVLPVLERAIPQYPDTFFSIDTTKYRVAKEALKLGAHFINDVSAMKREPRLVDLCIQHQAAYILMHSQGNPKTMQDDPKYDEVVSDIYTYFEEKIAAASGKGLEKLIIDPGIGFGKTLEHNLKLLAQLKKFKALGYPVLIGASRKSMISKLLGGRSADQRLAATLAIHYHAMQQGANILRVHDVQEASDTLRVHNALAEYSEVN